MIDRHMATVIPTYNRTEKSARLELGAVYTRIFYLPYQKVGGFSWILCAVKAKIKIFINGYIC